MAFMAFCPTCCEALSPWLPHDLAKTAAQIHADHTGHDTVFGYKIEPDQTVQTALRLANRPAWLIGRGGKRPIKS